MDATGDCDLAFAAGAATRYGNHGWVNLGTLGTRFGGIPAHVVLTADMIHGRREGGAGSAGVTGFTKERSVRRQACRCRGTS